MCSRGGTADALDSGSSTFNSVGVQISSAAPLYKTTKDDVSRMKNHERLYRLPFKDLYPNYVAKVIKKGRSEEEVQQVLTWLTGYQIQTIQDMLQASVDVRSFFNQSPSFHPNSSLIKGTICGVKLDEIDDPLMKKIRYLDKLIDELARGWSLDKILRQP